MDTTACSLPLFLFLCLFSVGEGENYMKMLTQQKIEPYTYYIRERARISIQEFLIQSSQWTEPDWVKDIPPEKSLLELFQDEEFGPLLNSLHILVILRLSDMKAMELMKYLHKGQIINYIPFRFLMDDKGMMSAMLVKMDTDFDYKAPWMSCVHKSNSFLPTTYVLTPSNDISDTVVTQDYWILKKSDGRKGQGIVLHKDFWILHDIWENQWKPDTAILQKYIQNPLLFNKKKFSIRNTVVIVQFEPLIVYSTRRRILLTEDKYNLEDTSKTSHLTNTDFTTTAQT